MHTLSRSLRFHLLLTDLGFLIYWSITAAGVLPASWLFKDYHNPILISWNWSFAPLDLLASAFGLLSVAASARGWPHWRQYALISAVLTCCAGLMAIAFWTLQRDFDPAWWAPNLYLLLWPPYCIPALIRDRS